MKPLIESILACLLIFVAGCTAIAGFFNAGLWTAIFAVASVGGLILVFASGTRDKQ